MGQYETKPTKQTARATAGPAADDRSGANAVRDIQSRILKVDVVNGRTRVTMAKGKSHGVQAGMEGYVVGAGGPLSELQIDQVDRATCFAFVDVTPDELTGRLNVIINPSKMRRARPSKDVAARVISVSVEGGRTKIIIARGTTHGIAVGMNGVLRAADGKQGNAFVIEGTTAMQSYAFVAGTVDEVTAHSQAVIHPAASSKP